jgi:hypothetical protein
MSCFVLPTRAVAILHEAGITHVTERTVRGWIDRGKIETVKIGKLRYIHEPTFRTKIAEWRSLAGNKEMTHDFRA